MRGNQMTREEYDDIGQIICENADQLGVARRLAREYPSVPRSRWSP